LMHTLAFTSVALIHFGKYEEANAQLNEIAALAEEKSAVFWKIYGALFQGMLLVLAGRAAVAVETIKSGLGAYRSIGSTVFAPSWLSYLASAHAQLGQFADAWRCVDEAMAAIETTNERWWEGDIYRMAGEIALLSPERDTMKAESYFQRALGVGRRQQAKSWELRAAMSMARLWRDQGKWQQAHDLLAPVYGWFTEGFDTLDLREAKALLEQLRT
jgi:predicted ATPase